MRALAISISQVPAWIPRCLWHLLPPRLQRRVASEQGVDAEVVDEGNEEGEMPASNLARSPYSYYDDDDDEGKKVKRRSPSVDPVASGGLSSDARRFSEHPGPVDGIHFVSQKEQRSAPEADSAEDTRLAFLSPGGSGIPQRSSDVRGSTQETEEPSRALSRAAVEGGVPRSSGEKPTIRIKKSVVDTVQAVLALQQLQVSNEWS